MATMLPEYLGKGNHLSICTGQVLDVCRSVPIPASFSRGFRLFRSGHFCNPDEFRRFLERVAPVPSPWKETRKASF